MLRLAALLVLWSYRGVRPFIGEGAADRVLADDAAELPDS